MRILFDHGTPRGIRQFLIGHSVAEARDEGWDALGGELLNAAEQAGYDLLLTTDKNIRYQQNLSTRKIAIVVLGQGRWTVIKPAIDKVIAAVNAASTGTYSEVAISG
jgi:hypothetical protein